jgi:LPS sulfotransferase NodH
MEETALAMVLQRRSRWRMLTHPKIWLRLQQWRYQIGLAAHWRWQPHEVYRPVFVLATARSGSNLLVDYLRRLPSVECHSEVLCTNEPLGISPRQANRQRAITHLRQSLHVLKAPVRGCKVMLNQFANCGLTLAAIEAAFPDARYLILYRQSLAEQFLSRESALLTDQWMLFDEQKRKQVRIPIDPVRLMSFAKETRAAYRAIFDHFLPPERSLILSYEQLTENPEAWLNHRIGPLLEVPAAAPQTILRKQNVLSIDQRVTNFHEVSSLLASPLCRQYYACPEQHSSRRSAA